MKTIQIIDQDTNQNFAFFDNSGDTILNKFEGFEYAPVRSVIESVAGEQSGVYLTSKFGPRRTAWGGDLVASDVFAQRRQLLNVLRQRGRMKLIRFTTYDDLKLQYEAEIVKYLNPYNHKVHTYLLEAQSPDWRFYSQELKVFTTGQTLIIGGTSIPATIPMGFPLSGSSVSSLNVNNAGNESTDPVITLYGPANQFTVINNTTGKQFVLDYAIAEGESIIVDVKSRTVIVNGVTSIYNALDGDFFNLQPGINEIQFTATGSNEDTVLKVEYRDAWNGV